MALPVTIATLASPQDSTTHLGPFVDASGNVYVVIGWQSGTTGRVSVYKATDPTSSFTLQDDTNSYSRVTGQVGGIAAYQEGTTIHIAWVLGNGASDGGKRGEHHYTQFDTSTDAYIEANNYGGSASSYSYMFYIANTHALSPKLDIAVESDGTLVIISDGESNSTMGGSYNHVQAHTKSTTDTWTTGVNIDFVASKNVNYWNPLVVMGGGDQAHVAYWRDSNGDFYQKGYTTTSTVRTQRTVTGTITTMPTGRALYTRSSTEKAVFVFEDNGATLRYDFTTFSDDTNPTIDTDQISASATANHSHVFALAVDVDDTDQPNYYARINGTSLQLLTDSGGETWSQEAADITTGTPTSIDGLSASIFERDGNFVFAFMYDDAGVYKYDEYVIRAAAGDVDVISGAPEALTITEYQATVANDVDISATTEALTLTEYQATITLDAEISASAEALTITEPQATISLDVDVDATAEAVTITEYQATVTNPNQDTDVVSSAPESLTITEYQAVVDIAFDVSASTEALTLTEFAADITSDVEVSAVTEALTITEPQATIVFDVDVAAAVETLTITEYAADIALGVNVEAVVEALTITEYTAAIGRDIDVLAAAEALTITENQSTVTRDIDVLGNVEALIITENQAIITRELDVLANVEALTITEYQSVITLPAGDTDVISGAPEALTITEYAATVANDVNIDGTTEAVTITEYSATVTLDVNVDATTESLVLTEIAAGVSSGFDIGTSNEALTITEQTATIVYDVEVSAVTETLTITEPQASVTNPADIDVSAVTEALTITEYQATVALDVEVSAVTEALTITEPQATIQTSVPTDVTASPAQLFIIPGGGGLLDESGNQLLDESGDPLLGEDGAATITSDVGVSAGTEAVTITEYQASVSYGPVTNIDAGLVELFIIPGGDGLVDESGRQLQDESGNPLLGENAGNPSVVSLNVDIAANVEPLTITPNVAQVESKPADSTVNVNRVDLQIVAGTVTITTIDHSAKAPGGWLPTIYVDEDGKEVSLANRMADAAALVKGKEKREIKKAVKRLVPILEAENLYALVTDQAYRDLAVILPALQQLDAMAAQALQDLQWTAEDETMAVLLLAS